VSRVLSGDDRRAVAETRERIFEAAKELGWRPNSVARSLSLGRAYALGMLIPTFANPAYASMIAGAQRAAEDSGNVLLVTDTSDNEARMRVQIERLADRADGFVVASASLRSPTIALLQERGLPFVLLNRRSEGEHVSVVGDDEAGVRMSLDYLADLGHQRIAYIAGPRGVDTVERRTGAFREFMRAHGLAVPKDWIYRGSLAPERLLAGLGRIMSSPIDERPTAVVAVNLLTASQVLSGLRGLGIAVPEEVSVVGFDDWPLAEHLWRPLTTVRMPTEAMGEQAVRELLAMLDGQGSPRETCVAMPPELIIRESTAPPPASTSRSGRRSR
jgi:LacI family transcriptional regulator